MDTKPVPEEISEDYIAKAEWIIREKAFRQFFQAQLFIAGLH
jgi:hypothetical protein